MVKLDKYRRVPSSWNHGRDTRAASNLKALSRKFFYLLGNPDDCKATTKILSWARGAAVAKRLRRDVVDSLSGLSPGQLNPAYDET